MSSSRYDFIPYPWPVKPALLYLLGLPEDTTKQEYEKRWNEAVAPAAEGKWADTLFKNEIASQQAQGKSFQQAWDFAISKGLFSACEREAQARSQRNEAGTLPRR